MNFNLPPLGVNVALIALILVAAAYDIRYRRIPNWLTLTGVVTGLALNTFIYQGWPGLRLSVFGLAVSFGVYFALYMLRAMGGGDVKLMAAIGALVGVRDWFGIFLIAGIIGGFAAVTLMVMRKRVRKTFWNVGFLLSEMKSGRAAYLSNEELDVRSPKSTGLPHGAVIAVAAAIFLALSLHFTQ